MKKYEAPELYILCFEMQEPLTSNEVDGGNISGGLGCEGDVEDGW